MMDRQHFGKKKTCSFVLLLCNCNRNIVAGKHIELLNVGEFSLCVRLTSIFHQSPLSWCELEFPLLHPPEQNMFLRTYWLLHNARMQLACQRGSIHVLACSPLLTDSHNGGEARHGALLRVQDFIPYGVGVGGGDTRERAAIWISGARLEYKCKLFFFFVFFRNT